MIAALLIERQRRRVDVRQHALDERRLERLRLLPPFGAQKRRNFQGEHQMRLQVADQKQRRGLFGAQLPCNDPLFQVLRQRRAPDDAQLGLVDDLSVQMKQRIAESGAHRHLVREHLLRRVNAHAVGQKIDDGRDGRRDRPVHRDFDRQGASRLHGFVLGERMAVLVGQEAAQRDVVMPEAVMFERAAIDEHRAFGEIVGVVDVDHGTAIDVVGDHRGKRRRRL